VAPKQWNHKQCPIPSAGDDVLGRCLGDGRKVLNLCCVATTYSAFEDWLAEPDMLIPQRRDQLLAHAVSRAQLQFFLLLIELVDRASFRAGEQDCSRHMVDSTVARSSVELTAWLTSPRARNSSTERARSVVRSRSSLSNLAFSIAMTACRAKFVTSSICFSVKGRTSCR